MVYLWLARLWIALVAVATTRVEASNTTPPSKNANSNAANKRLDAANEPFLGMPVAAPLETWCHPPSMRPSVPSQKRKLILDTRRPRSLEMTGSPSTSHARLVRVRITADERGNIFVGDVPCLSAPELGCAQNVMALALTASRKWPELRGGNPSETEFEGGRVYDDGEPHRLTLSSGQSSRSVGYFYSGFHTPGYLTAAEIENRLVSLAERVCPELMNK